jgi:hypothetical protein
MDYLRKMIDDIEIHSPDGIRECFENGIGANDLFRGEPLIHELTSEYGRTPRFRECVKVFVDHGLQMDDKAMLAVLLDDAVALEKAIEANPGCVHERHTQRNAYTQMREVNLLHICAEFNHTSCAAVLVEHGVAVNVKAGVDEFGFGGQSPIFHTVNQNSHNSKEMLEFLLDHHADLTTTVKGLIWGKGYSWETFIPAVNPISYAMVGLLPQMHRRETTISEVVSRLIKEAYGIDYEPPNVPCKYLR